MHDIITISPASTKKVAVKTFLTDRMKKEHPSFRFLTFATGVYHFQRMKEFRDFDLREALHLVLYVDERRMHASISSRLNHVHTLSPVYNNGFINPHVDLLAIKTGNTLPGSEAYHYDGTPDDLHQMVNVMISDFRDTGIPYLEDRWNDLRANKLVKAGLDIIDEWDFDRTMLRNELNVQLRKARLSVGNLRHPLLNDLREQLFAVPGQPQESIKEIPRLAFELMELYCASQITP